MPIASALRGTARRHPWIREVALFAAALVVYQAARALVIGDAETAFANAGRVMGAERVLGLFVERDVQAAVMGADGLVRTLNAFYLSAHWVVTALFFVWLYRRRRGAYRRVRDAFLVANAIALVVFVLFPVAPPRLAGGGAGMVDTLDAVSGVDLHGGVLSGLFNPHAAVPSMHFGYAFLIGAVGVALVRSPLARALLVAYPALVLLTIVGTGNHFVIDALAGAGVVVLGFAAVAVAPYAGRVRARTQRSLTPTGDGAYAPSRYGQTRHT